jgi:TonB-linked SusC/RagA family outer membrane protein
MRKKLLLSFCAMLLFNIAILAQTTATGKVVDEKGNGIAGASVLEKGTRNGTITSSDGSFSLKVKAGAKLVISEIGYENAEVASGTGLSVKLKTDTKALSEVVVTGVGAATSKKKLAFAVESISADKLPQAPSASIDQALVGKIAGAQISSTNGSPGSPTQILLRGINSIRGGTAPMILIDGLQVASTGLENLDLNSIERVEVVQGPAASTIYGAQGANGVIQLFTKKGKQGKVEINYSSSVGINSLLNIGDVNKAKRHAFNVNGAGEVVNSSNVALSFDPVTGSYLSNPVVNLVNPASAYNKNYDKNLLWYDHYAMFFRSAATFNNSISITGAKDKLDFSIVASNSWQETVFKNNGDYNRTNFTVNLGVELLKGLKLRSITQLVNTKNTQLDPDGRNMFYAINNARPFANFEQRDAAGLHSPYFGDAVGVNHYNFNYIIENAKYVEKNLDVVQNLNLNYKVNKFLELDAKYGINRSGLNRKYQIADQTASEGAEYWQYWAEFYSPRTSFGAPTTGTESGEINQREFIDLFQNLIATGTVKFRFDEDLKLKVPISSTTQFGWDWRKRNISDFWSYGLDAPAFSPYTAADMGSFKIDRDTRTDFATYGYFINQRFEFAEVAGISGGFRSDYSSAFGSGSKPFTFPRGDAYLRLSALNFWQGSKISNTISEFKVRAAFGQAGIQPGAYDRFPILNSGVIGSQSQLSTPVSNANPNLNIEVSKEFEIGTDISLKLGKGKWFTGANLSFTYWNRTSEDVIDQVDVAPSTGVGRQLTNAMALQSNGIQASLNIPIYTSKDFNWNLTTNFGRQKSIIKSVINNAELIKTSAAGSAQYVLRAGERIGQLYGYLMLNSVDQLDPNGNPAIPVADKVNYEVASNGWVVHKTTRQPYATAGRFSLGDPNPKFNMSFINEFSYKNIVNVSMQWDWLEGNNVYNQTKGWMYRDGIHKDYDGQITINGQTDAWSSFYRGVYAVRAFNGTKNYFMEDASFWRLRNLVIGFDINKLVNIKGLTKLQLVFTGRNLVTFTKYTGMDPEVSSGTLNSGWDRGVDHNTIPNIKTYQFGLNVGF